MQLKVIILEFPVESGSPQRITIPTVRQYPASRSLFCEGGSGVLGRGLVNSQRRVVASGDSIVVGGIPMMQGDFIANLEQGFRSIAHDIMIDAGLSNENGSPPTVTIRL